MHVQGSHTHESGSEYIPPIYRGERMAARDNQRSKRATHVSGRLGPTAHSPLNKKRESLD